jgi:hypothetical protein
MKKQSLPGFWSKRATNPFGISSAKPVAAPLSLTDFVNLAKPNVMETRGWSDDSR